LTGKKASAGAAKLVWHGVAHGFATLGTWLEDVSITPPSERSNVASRRDEIPGNPISLGLDGGQDAVTVEPVGDFALKGISRPVAAYNVLRHRQKFDPDEM
jgi:hypothetical protein